MSFLPFSFVSFFPYATTCLPALFSCSCPLFRFFVSSHYLRFCISCNTILHTHLYSRTCLSIAQTDYIILGPIHNTLLRQLTFPQHLFRTSAYPPHHQAHLHLLLPHHSQQLHHHPTQNKNKGGSGSQIQLTPPNIYHSTLTQPFTPPIYHFIFPAIDEAFNVG